MAVIIGLLTVAGVFVATWLGLRAQRRPRGCTVLHRIAELEQSLYGEVMSASAAQHLKECDLDVPRYFWPRPDPTVAVPTPTTLDRLRSMVETMECLKQAMAITEDPQIRAELRTQWETQRDEMRRLADTIEVRR